MGAGDHLETAIGAVGSVDRQPCRQGDRRIEVPEVAVLVSGYFHALRALGEAERPPEDKVGPQEGLDCATIAG